MGKITKKRWMLLFGIFVLSLSVVLSTAASTPPNIEWERIFGGSNYDASYAVQQASDGGYIIAGNTRSFGAGCMDAYLIKTDKNGYKKWEKTFGNISEDYFRAIEKTTEGGYIIAGTINGYCGGWSSQDGDAYLVKINSSGTKLWEKNFGGSRGDYGYSVQQTSDGGYILAGGSHSYSYGGWCEDFYLIKTDNQGNKVWEKSHGWGENDEARSVQQTTDGGYILAGYTYGYKASSCDVNQIDVYLVKTDPNGTRLWEKNFGGSSSDWGYSVQQTSDGGYIIAGNKGWGYIILSKGLEQTLQDTEFGATSEAEVSDYVYLIKTDSNGNKLWEKSFNGGSGNVGYSVKQTSDGGFVIAVNSGRIIKTDSKGNITWEKRINDSKLRSVQQTSDGGYIASGIKNNDVYLVKLSSDVGKAPSLFNLPDKNISQDSKPEAGWIDLWDYVSDEDTPKENLKFSVESQSDSSLINCWIDRGRYITCDMPTKGKSGYSDVTLRVEDPQGLSGTDLFRINILSPSLTILFLPFDWGDPYINYSRKVDELASYFLERIPLSDCPEQFKFIKIKENENYGGFWNAWKCNTSGTHNLSNEHCFYSKVLGRIDDCAEQYKKSKNEEYDYAVGISDNNIFLLDDSSCKDLAGWSGGLPSVIAETRTLKTATHEVGHQFGLDDQYCDCSGTSYESYCGPSAPKSPLNITLGCDYKGDCCWNATSTIYPYNPSCKWCIGNFDRFGKDTNLDQILDKGNRTLMGLSSLGHFDTNEYVLLSDLSELQCKSKKILYMSAPESRGELSFNLKIMLRVDKNDSVEIIELVSTDSEPFEIESKGEYYIKILDQNNNSVYLTNFSANFIIFSDPPIITNETQVLIIIPYYENMRKFEVYEYNNLILSGQIPSFCNKNTICEAGENYLSCSDCKSNAKDGICNREKGDGCDFDCIEGLDSDCVDLIIKNVTLSRNLTEGKKAEVKINLSNFGVRNATFEIGVFSDSILETNASIKISGNFSTLVSFNWTPQQACLKDLIFSLDFPNTISEFNELNNEFQIENVTINLKGDIKQDNKIDIFDLASVGLCYGQAASGSCQAADTNQDGSINIFDLATVGLNYGKSC